jgi:hypothetical protein
MLLLSATTTGVRTGSVEEIDDRAVKVGNVTGTASKCALGDEIRLSILRDGYY